MYQLRGTPTRGLIGATLGFFVGFAAVSLFGPTVKAFSREMEEMELSPLLIGLLVAAPSLSGSLLRIPFGAWADRNGGKKPILVSLILSALGVAGILVVILTSHSGELEEEAYPLLVVLGLLGGCGIVTFSPGIGQVSYWFPQERQGSALGIFAGVGNLAPGIFALFLPISLAGLGLGTTYLAWLVFLAIGIVLYYLLGVNAFFFQLKGESVDLVEARKIAREHGQTIFPRGTATQSLARAARMWKTWALVAIYFTSFGGFLGLTAWFPTYWAQFYQTDLVLAGTLTAVFSILTSLVRVGGGTLSDRFGGERTALVSIVVMIVASGFITVSSNFVLSLAAAAVMGIGMGITNAAVFKIVPSVIREAVGGASGWIGGIGAFGGFVIPPVLAAFVSAQGRSGYSLGFITLTALSVISLALMYLMSHSKKQAAIGTGRQNRASAA